MNAGWRRDSCRPMHRQGPEARLARSCMRWAHTAPRPTKRPPAAYHRRRATPDHRAL